jgi:WD40 repeat protein
MAQLWDVTRDAGLRPLGKPLTAASGGSVASLSFGPGGILAGVESNGTTQLWDVTDPARPRPLGQPMAGSDDAEMAVLSPGGHTLAVTGADGTIRLWNVADPADPQLLGQPVNTSGSGGAASVAFSPDGRTLASGDGNGTIQLWNLPQTILPGSGSGMGVASLAFSPDGRSLATSLATDLVTTDLVTSDGGAIRLWNMSDQADPELSGQITDTAPVAGPVAFGAGDRTLAAYEQVVYGVKSLGVGVVQVWDVSSPAHPRSLGRVIMGDSADTAAISPDGRTLAVPALQNSGLSEIRLWDIAGPAVPAPTGQPVTGTAIASAVINSLAFSPDGRTLAAGQTGDSGSGDISLWDVADTADPQPLGVTTTGSDGTIQAISGTNSIESMTFSPDGRVLATLTFDGTVQLWNTADLMDPRGASQLPEVTTGLVSSIAFSPDGALAAADGEAGTIQLWNVADPVRPQPIGPPLNGGNEITSITFSPDGILATGTISGETLLLNLNVSQAIEQICATTKGSLTAQQWHQYIPQLPYQPPCTARHIQA